MRYPRCLPSRTVVPLAVALLTSLALASARAQQPARESPRWAPIRRVFGQPGSAERGYFRIELPRHDLHVRIGGDALAPAFEFTSYVGFMPVGPRHVMAMGELVLRDDEVAAALAEAHRQGVHVTAVHNHLLGETPRIVYVHVLMPEGSPETVATKLRAVFAKTATPLAAERGGSEPDRAPRVDWSAIDAVLGPHAEAEDSVAEWVFPRREALAVRGLPVRSTGTLETASEVVFQRLDATRVAATGELFVLPTEVEAVARVLDDNGLHVTALHNHMLDATPVMYWIHWYATGDGATLARGVAAALARMNGARRSE